MENLSVNTGMEDPVDLRAFSQYMRKTVRPLIRQVSGDYREVCSRLRDLRYDRDLIQKGRSGLLTPVVAELDKQIAKQVHEQGELKQTLSLLAGSVPIQREGRWVTADPWDQTLAPWRRAEWARLVKIKSKNEEQEYVFRLLELVYSEVYADEWQ